MPTYKDEKTGLWYCKFVYKDWTGKSKQKKKMGFKLQREAKEWELDFLNKYSGDLIAVFLTTQPKKEMETHVTIRSIKRESVALCEQPTTVSISRIQRYIGRVTEKEMQQIERALLCAMNIKEAGGKKKCFQSGYKK